MDTVPISFDLLLSFQLFSRRFCESVVFPQTGVQPLLLLAPSFLFGFEGELVHAVDADLILVPS